MSATSRRWNKKLAGRQIEDALLVIKLQPHPLNQFGKRRTEKINHARNSSVQISIEPRRHEEH